MRYILSLFLLLTALPVHAQEPVNHWADWASYGTAAINPAWAAIEAARSDHKGCKFAQLGLTELIGNGIGLAGQHFITSPRPCLGCPPHGMPSLHEINSWAGASSHWGWGVSFTWATAVGRYEAHRHTKKQLAAGAAAGLFSEWLGHAIIRCEE